MATQSEVNNYLNYVRQEVARYGSQLADLHQRGDEPNFPMEIKFMLLVVYNDIADHYLDKWDDANDDNFFTVEEFKDIMRHINAICNSFLWLELD